MRRVSDELAVAHEQRDAGTLGERTIDQAKLITAYSLTARVLHWVTITSCAGMASCCA
jgi:hypothetical protein